jgi:hypothetical protein
MVREGRRRGGKRLFNSCCWNCTVAEEDEAQLRRCVIVINNSTKVRYKIQDTYLSEGFQNIVGMVMR